MSVLRPGRQKRRSLVSGRFRSRENGSPSPAGPAGAGDETTEDSSPDSGSERGMMRKPAAMPIHRHLQTPLWGTRPAPGINLSQSDRARGQVCRRWRRSLRSRALSFAVPLALWRGLGNLSSGTPTFFCSKQSF